MIELMKILVNQELNALAGQQRIKDNAVVVLTWLRKERPDTFYAMIEGKWRAVTHLNGYLTVTLPRDFYTFEIQPILNKAKRRMT
jgi:hypothetical protein